MVRKKSGYDVLDYISIGVGIIAVVVLVVAIIKSLV